MNKKKDKKSAKKELINLLQSRIKSLEIEKQHYEQNPNLMKNIKVFNIEEIQNDIEALKNISNAVVNPSH